MTKLKTIIEFYREGEIMPNFKELEKVFGIDRRTIKKYYEDGYPGKITRERKSELDDYVDIICGKLAIPGITYIGIHDLLRKKYGVTTSYSNFTQYLKSNKLVKGANRVKTTFRFETAEGVQAQVDWKENFTLINDIGEDFTFNVFVMIMSYSRKIYTEITNDRTQETLFKCLRNAFIYFDGVPKRVLFDNMSTVVDRTVKGEKKKINNKLRQFAADAGFEIMTTSVRNPQAKGKVETQMKIVDRLLAYNFEFEYFEEIVTIMDELRDKSNSEVSQATNMIPNLLFLREKEYLKPLNDLIAQKYKGPTKTYKVSNESLFSYKGSKYSVPIEYMHEFVSVTLVNDHLHVNYNNKIVAIHKKTKNKINYLEDHYEELAEMHLKSIDRQRILEELDTKQALEAFDKLKGDY